MYQNESENLKPAKFKFRKRIITIAAIALCGLVAGITALVTTNDSSNNAHAAAWLSIKVQVSSYQVEMGTVYISKIERQTSQTDTTWITETFTQAQAKTSANIYNDFNSNGSNTTKVTFTAVAYSGYQISYWNRSDKVGSLNSGLNSYTFETCCNGGDEDRTVTVYFAPTSYEYHTVTVVAGANGTIPTGSVTKQTTSGGTCYIKVTPNEGYTVSHVEILNGTGNCAEAGPDDLSLSYIYVYKVTGDVKVRVHFTNIKYNVTIKITPSQTATMSKESGKYGMNTPMDLMLTSDPGYTSSKWVFTHNGRTINYGSKTRLQFLLKSDATIEVTMIPRNWNLSTSVSNDFYKYLHVLTGTRAISSGAGSFSLNPVATTSTGYLNGTSVSVKLTENYQEYFLFTGWTIKEMGIEVPNNYGTSTTINIRMTSHIIAIANFKVKNTLEVNTSTSVHDIPMPSGGGGVVEKSVAGETFFYNDKVVLTARPIEGFYTQSWTISRVGYLTETIAATSNTYEIIMTRDTIITANFAQKQPYPITLNVFTYDNNTLMSAVGGTVTQSPVGSTILYGDEVTFTATAYEGFGIRSWTVVANGVTNTYDKLESITFVMSGDTVVTANFNKMYKLEAG